MQFDSRKALCMEYHAHYNVVLVRYNVRGAETSLWYDTPRPHGKLWKSGRESGYSCGSVSSFECVQYDIVLEW